MNRKLLSDPYLAIHGKIMAKNGHFLWNFDLFLTFYIDCDHIYVPNEDLVMTLFLLWGRPFMTGDVPKMAHFEPKMAKHGRLVNAPKWSKRDQNGQPKSF